MTAAVPVDPIPAARPDLPPKGLLWSALATVYLVWGSTYLGIRIVVEHLPALGAMGVRFLVAGTVMAVVVGLRSGWRSLRPGRSQVAAAGLVGVLLLACGNGGVAVAEQTVPSGLAALLVAAMPLWLVLLRVLARDRPRSLTVVGTVVGFVGIGVLARPGGHGGSVEWWGIAVILAGALAWAVGTFLSPRIGLPRDPFVATTYEMLLAGLVMAALSAAGGEWRGLDLAAVPASAWWALGYLTVVGSLVAFTAFVWLAGHAPLSLVTTYAYVNPVVAVCLGWLVLAEPVTAAIVGGGALAVLGVFLVVRSESARRVSARTRPAPPRPGGSGRTRPVRRS